jgi:hypothetical protein
MAKGLRYVELFSFLAKYEPDNINNRNRFVVIQSYVAWNAVPCRPAALFVVGVISGLAGGWTAPKPAGARRFAGRG